MLQFEELMLTLRNMKPDMDDLKEALGYDKLTAEIAELEQKAAAPDFWDDMENSQKVLKRTATLKGKVAAFDAIEHKYDDTMTLIELGDEEGELELLGYNVYIHGEQINSELITGNSFSWVIEDGDYTVTAFYSNGESLPSEAVTVATGIHSILATDSPVQVFDLTGKQLNLSGKWSEISTHLSPGIYVVKSNNSSTKVVIH